MKCWKCGFEMPDPEWGKLTFRALCDKCNASLHCCKNCKHYKPGAPNDCAVPGTDFVPDREAANFCEEFSLKGEGPAAPKTSKKEVEKRLFGESTSEKPGKNNFDSLFKD